MEGNMDRSWMPTTSGIINIVLGSAAIILFLVLLIIGIAGSAAMGFASADLPAFIPALVFTIFGFVFLALGIVAIIGGVYALKKKKWGMALAGSIVSVFICWPFAAAALVFIIMSQKEFA